MSGMVSAVVTWEKGLLVARLSDGQIFSSADSTTLADLLLGAGIEADAVTMPDWRAGEEAPLAGQRMAIFRRMRRATLDRGQSSTPS